MSCHHHQQPYQMPLLNTVTFHQQFNTSQMRPSNYVLPGGQPSFCAGPTFAPWNPMLIGQNSFNQSQAIMGMQGQHAPPSMYIGEQGFSSGGFQMAQNRDFHPPPAISGRLELLRILTSDRTLARERNRIKEAVGNSKATT